MTETNRAIITSLIDSIDDFVDGKLEIADVQSRLQARVDLLERTPRDLISVVRAAEVDLERIQFTMLLDEQRPAAVFRLDSLRAALQAALESE
jgi:hypothetical protein